MSAGGNKKTGTILGALGLLGLAAFKFKAYLFMLFKGASFIKFAWMFKSFLSMFITIGIYAVFLGWPFAVMVVLLILIHELGHFVWMKALGLKPNLPMFVPFIGAYVAMTKLPPDQATHAWVSIAGPLVGGLGAAVFYWAGLHMNNIWLMAAGSTGFLLNLIQLVPAKPLDGGFIIQSLSKWLLIPGTGLLFALSLYLHSFLLLIISIFSLFALFHQFKNAGKERAYAPGSRWSASMPPPEDERASHDLIPASGAQKVLIGIAYVSLTGMLGYLYWLSHSETVSMMPEKHRQELIKKTTFEEPGQSDAAGSDGGEARPDAARSDGGEARPDAARSDGGEARPDAARSDGGDARL